MSILNRRLSSFICFLSVFALSFLSFGFAAHAERLSVKSNIANIRSGPSTTHKVLWQVEKYHPLDVINKKGKWYHFKDFEGDSGWIHNSLLSKTATVITKTKCNIRTGPGTKHKIAFTAEKGIPLKIKKKKGKWLNVVHADGDTGWIFNSLVW